MNMPTKTATPQDVKNDSKGALAPSQADSHNNGALAIDPDETHPSKHKNDKHSAPTSKSVSGR